MSTLFSRTPRYRSLSGLVASAAAAVTLLLSAADVQAAYASMVVASGLNNPRGLAFGPDGALYIAEAGLQSGDGPTTIVREVVNTYTETGSVTRVQGGVQTRVLNGLSSIYGSDVSGPNDVTFTADGRMHVTIGAGIDPNVRATQLAPGGIGLGQLVAPGRSVDIAGYEAANNPAGGPLDSNPWRAVATADGMLVTDAGANALLRVADDGSITRVADFPSAGPEFVPTGLAIGPDGAIYIGFLTGFPFVPGSSQVLRIEADGSTSVFASGFTNVTDIAFGPDDKLYVLEFDANGMLVDGDAGALIRVEGDGSHTTIFSEGLVAPTGLAIGPDGAFYVSNYGPATGSGEVLRIAEVPEPGTLALLGLGVLAMYCRSRRQPR